MMVGYVSGSSAAVAAAVASCSAGTTTTAGGTTTTGSTTSTTVATGGAALFNSYCAACHTGAATMGGGRQVVGARTCSINASLTGTKNVFPAGVPAMAFLKGLLSPAQIQSIADHLNTGTVTGQQRYITACAGCHGIDARGGRVGENVRGASASETSSAIRSNEGGMGIMNCLPSSDISAIASYLNGQTATTTTTRASTTTTRWGTTTTTRRFNPPATHTERQDGFLHMPGKNSPYTNGCTTCHGATLQGGFAPSCYTCHGKEWSESAGTTTTTRASTTTTTRSTTTTTRRYNPPATHTESKHGFLHMPGFKYPFQNGCTTCHGATLQGGFAPSCYTCHGKKWN